MELECTDDYDDGMQEWVVEMECSGDYDDGMQELVMEMECTGEYDDGMQEGGVPRLRMRGTWSGLQLIRIYWSRSFW